MQTHAIFCLHHGPLLSDLHVRLGRQRFCSTLDRFWSRFARSWDVLLHGNPAVDIFDGLKLASGGELGYGVGEEEWGSGERAVLEDLSRHTEGLVDVVVSRFGDAPVEEATQSSTEDDRLPWLGSGKEPAASDGVVFSGVGALQRQTLADVSLWMRRVYTYGDSAYGVRDNPLRERRKRRKLNPPKWLDSANGTIAQTHGQTAGDGDVKTLMQDDAKAIEPASATSRRRVQTVRPVPMGETRTLSVDDARSNIPPPIATAAEESLKNATKQAGYDKTDTGDNTEEAGTTLGIPDQYMKYLTFGLSTLGKSSSKVPPSTKPSPDTGQQSLRPPATREQSKITEPTPISGDEDDAPMLKHVEPMPEGDALKSRIATQRQLESKGYFLIGLKGDLDDLNEEDAILSDASANDLGGLRIVLRTVQVQTVPIKISEPEDESLSKLTSGDTEVPEHPMKDFKRMRVLIYVRQPFIYCFLFENRTSSLSYTKFYKLMHLNLAPIYKPLLASTDPAKAAERLGNPSAAVSESDAASISSTTRTPSKSTTTNPIYHLVYDPQRLTVHTSIPNIPEPGTPAAEGILTALTGVGDSTGRSNWTRIEAMNVHSQILNTLASVKRHRSELERTSKTSRGWWVVWLKVPPPSNMDDDNTVTAEDTSASQPSSNQYRHRIAFLVRKATEGGTSSPKPSSTGSRAMSSMLSNMSFGLAGRDEDETGGASAGFGPAALAGGIGVDARKYVDWLLSSLSR